MKRRVAVVTGTRAEYGLLKRILRLLSRDSRFKLQLLVTGQHLMPEFGATVTTIVKDGFSIAARIPLELSGDQPRAISEALGKGVSGFAKAFQRLAPDIVLVLGDRYEMLAAASAALPFRIPVAHIHGGEATEGLIDEQIRHAVTKLSHLHFVAARMFRERVIQMGEQPRNVFWVGAPGVDGLERAVLLDEPALRRELGVPEGKRLGLFTYHPLTLTADAGVAEARATLDVMTRFPDVHWVLTMPNVDTGFAAIARLVKSFAAHHKGRAALRPSLGKLYLSAMKHASVMVGNSSSGLIEAPSFGLPVVNIGDRQAGRLRGTNVIDVPDARRAERAIRRALTPAFRRVARAKNPYARAGTARRIVEVLRKTKLDGTLIRKRFHVIR